MRVPKFEDIEVTKFFDQYIKETEKKENNYLMSKSSNHSILLISPSRKTYEVTVSDAGALVITLVQG